MSWFKSHHNSKDKGKGRAEKLDDPPLSAPPKWEPAPEKSHTFGLYNEASDGECAAARRYCAANPVRPPKLLHSDDVDRIGKAGGRAWRMIRPAVRSFRGTVSNCDEHGGGPGVVQVKTDRDCLDTCLFSDLPVLAGLYDIRGKSGTYYEVLIHRMDGIVALGIACKPYPVNRFPGWNRLSAGLHLDDFRKFFEDEDGGRDYTPLLTRVQCGDTIGCGYEFSTGSVFFTHNGVRLPVAFSGVFLPRTAYDVYAAIGVEGKNQFDVNFGGELFRWKEGNEWAWRVEGHVGGHLGDTEDVVEAPPTYQQARYDQRL